MSIVIAFDILSLCCSQVLFNASSYWLPASMPSRAIFLDIRKANCFSVGFIPLIGLGITGLTIIHFNILSTGGNFPPFLRPYSTYFQ